MIEATGPNRSRSRPWTAPLNSSSSAGATRTSERTASTSRMVVSGCRLADHRSWGEVEQHERVRESGGGDQGCDDFGDEVDDVGARGDRDGDCDAPAPDEAVGDGEESDLSRGGPADEHPHCL